MRVTAMVKGALNRPGHRAADVPDDVQVDLGVVQGALPPGIKGVEHQGGHRQVGEQQLGGACGHEFLAGELRGVAVGGVGDLRMVPGERRGQVGAVLPHVDLHVTVLVIVAPGDQGQVPQRGGVAAHQETGGVVVHHEKDQVARGHQPGHVFWGDVFRRRPKGQALELLGQFAGLHFGLVAQPGEGLAGGVGALEGVPVNQGETGRVAGVLQEAAEKGQQGAADPTDADGFDFHSEQ